MLYEACATRNFNYNKSLFLSVKYLKLKRNKKKRKFACAKPVHCAVLNDIPI